MSSYLQTWGVRTLLPLETVTPLSVKFWGHGVLRASGLGPQAIQKLYFGSTIFWKYRDQGAPVPAILTASGTAGPALQIEREYSGTLRLLAHPLFVLLSAPGSGSGLDVVIRGLSAEAQLSLAKEPEARMKWRQQGLRSTDGDHPNLLEALANKGMIDVDHAAAVVALVVDRCLFAIDRLSTDFMIQCTRQLYRCLVGWPIPLREEVVDRLMFLPHVYQMAFSNFPTPREAAAHLAKNSLPAKAAPPAENIIDEIGEALFRGTGYSASGHSNPERGAESSKGPTRRA